MGKPIEVGCLAMIVNACCGARSRHLGKVGTVAWIKNKITYCPDCKHENHGPHTAINTKASGCPVGWLIRIDPPPISESTETSKELENV